jgi:hypothetical protein
VIETLRPTVDQNVDRLLSDHQITFPPSKFLPCLSVSISLLQRWFNKHEPSFLDDRQLRLQDLLNALLRNPLPPPPLRQFLEVNPHILLSIEIWLILQAKLGLHQIYCERFSLSVKVEAHVDLDALEEQLSGSNGFSGRDGALGGRLHSTFNRCSTECATVLVSSGTICAIYPGAKDDFKFSSSFSSFFVRSALARLSPLSLSVSTRLCRTRLRALLM